MRKHLVKNNNLSKETAEKSRFLEMICSSRLKFFKQEKPSSSAKGKKKQFNQLQITSSRFAHKVNKKEAKNFRIKDLALQDPTLPVLQDDLIVVRSLIGTPLLLSRPVSAMRIPSKDQNKAGGRMKERTNIDELFEKREWNFASYY